MTKHLFNKTTVAGLIFMAVPTIVMAVPYQAVPVANGGTISGKITTSKTPANPVLKFTKDKKYCGGSRKANYYIVGAGGALKNAVVVIENIDKGKAYKKGAIIPFANKKCMFVPHVSIAVAGQRLGVVSKDPILHNTHLYSGPKLRTMYNIAIPLMDRVIKKPLRKTGLVTVKCDAHEWMLGYVYVGKNPYLSLSAANGTFSIKDIPPGSYKVKIWHEKLGEVTKEITVSAGKTTKLNYAF